MKKLLWDESYELLQEYLIEHNGRYPTANEIYKGFKLGVWVQTQRVTYNNGMVEEDGSIRYKKRIITKERQEKLNNINFLWNSNTDDEKWEEKYELLIEYLKYNDEYPKYSEIYKSTSIGRWVIKQRTIYNNGKKLEDGSIEYKGSSLTKERIDKLNAINFLWDLWDEKYNLLKEYLDEHNGVHPNVDEEYENISLGQWVKIQRYVYNNGEKDSNGSIRFNQYLLTRERINKLNEIGFIWKVDIREKMDNTWNSYYELLQEYLKEYNGKYPSSDTRYKNKTLGSWVQTQRVIYNNGEKQEDGSYKYGSSVLTKKRIDKLNKKGFIWSCFSNSWEEKYELLQEYLKEHNGTYPKYSEYYKGVALGTWIGVQRTIYNNGQILEDGSYKYKINVLTKERIDKLNKIGFKWVSYAKSDYLSIIKSNKKEELLKKKLLCKLKMILEQTKNEIENKENIEEIEKEFIKSLIIFD